jgi:hypothetical protein
MAAIGHQLRWGACSHAAASAMNLGDVVLARRNVTFSPKHGARIEAGLPAR